MIDLRNIAQQLRLPADQLRIAADLLEQGYQPAFIARYRADETGHLPEPVLWSLKFAIDREQQLATARSEAIAHLGEGVELDEEVKDRLARAATTVDIDVTLRCFRARRAAKQSGERSGQASALLEKLIGQSQPVADLNAWVAEQMSVDISQAEPLLQQAQRLVGTLLSGDTRLVERIRSTIQKRANVHVDLIADQAPRNSQQPAATTNADATSPEDALTASSLSASSPSPGPTESGAAGTDGGAESRGVVWSTAGDEENLADHADVDAVEDHSVDVEHAETEVAAETPSESLENSSETSVAEADSPLVLEQAAGQSSTLDETTESAAPDISLTFETAGKKPRGGKLLPGKRKDKDPAKSAKSLVKLTPRQRRRRWLVSVLQPFKSLKKPLHRLTAYQMLMLGRGQRSQLTKVELQYDRRQMVNIARDVFVNDSHPLAPWFSAACDHALQASLLAKIESDALAEQDEMAQQRLLESATDQLRAALLQRPVKGHRILVVDTVGPKSSCIAIIDARGKCLMTEEVVCSSQPSVVSQNVIRLGELVHKHKVTLVALSNGPARRFLVHTVAELMKQSASSNLRWTMVDRGGAEAYATSRHASLELPQLNRRFRAAVWLGRRLQDPLGELLKVDPSRLRLGSYQRELPQEPLKRLVAATLADCVCVKGVDARHATEPQFAFVPGVSPEVAKQLADLASARAFVSREALQGAIGNWSETGKRQALGFLRIYNSPETLDGTLVHPDDYRLAQRLIQNTELVAPQAAPPGWLPPKVKQPKIAKSQSKPVDAAGTDDVLIEGTSEAPVGATSDEASPSPMSDSPAAEIAASVETTETVATTDNQAETSVDPILTNESASSSEATESAGASVEAEPAAAESVVPEYSEDVVVQQAQAPAIDVEKLARGWQVGRAKLAWVAQCLSHPFDDARSNRPPVPMLPMVPSLSELKPGMSVYAIVVGVAEFGAFVELGPDCGGLIHISRLSSRYIEDPHQSVQIGDLLQAWVVSVDVEKKRVALTTLSPEEQKLAEEAAARSREQARDHRNDRSGGNRPSGQQGNSRASTPQGQSGERGQRAGGGRPAGGRPSQGGDSRGGPRGGRPGGGQHGGQQAGRGRGRGAPSRNQDDMAETHSKPVIVKSKKPAKPLTEAMQKGQEPLRSFSDLMQFYTLQRDPVPTNTTAQANEAAPSSETAAPPAVTEPNAVENEGQS